MQKPLLWQIPQPDYSEAQIDALRQKLDQRLREAAETDGRVVQMSSLAVEDMVITETIARLDLPFDIAIIDTGMLNVETLDTLQKASAHFGRHIQIYRPLTSRAEALLAAQGKLGFYESVDKRRACCSVRKSEPLTRALQNASAWITGQRRSQSITRAEIAFQEDDTAHNILKFNPIFDFSEKDVWAYAHAKALPINPLYFRGYPSIGCAPCSKAVRANEDIRAGRWWWENAATKECGLHQSPTLNGTRHDHA